MARVTLESNSEWPATFLLGNGRHVRLRAEPGTVVVARAGALWITVSTDPRDIVLTAGQCFALDRGASVLIGSLGGPAVVETAASGRLACAA